VASARSRLARTLRGWAVYFAGIASVFLVDRVLRLHGHERGLGEPLLPFVILLFAAVALALMWRGAAAWSTPARLVLVAVQGCAGVVVYGFAALAYFCGTGVDCP
jgi:hypothetical protein